jgi:hypothetical protein
MEEVRNQWLTSIILATQKSEIRRIVVQSQLGQTVRDPISKKKKKKKSITKQGWQSGSSGRVPA